MKSEQRQTLLKVAALGVVGLFLLDRLVITPATHSWSDQSDRIDALSKKVAHGDTLIEREKTIRQRWTAMKRANLPPDNSVAEDAAYRAFVRWVQASGVTIVSQTAQWQNHEDGGYETFELRVTATGDQMSLGKFVYALEVDPLPVNLEESEITTRDTHGALLTMTMRVSFARLAAAAVGNTGRGQL